VAAFSTAQIARNRRISAWAQNLLSRLRDRPDRDIERASVVHRTMCDVLCTMCDVLCTMCDVLCTMCDVLCTMFDVRCTMRRALHDVRRALAQPPPSIGTAVDQAGPIGATRVWSILARSGRPAAPHSGHGCHIGPTTSAAPADHRAPVLQLINQAEDAAPASHAPNMRAALAPDKNYIEINGAGHHQLGSRINRRSE
jgi:hypothetical protein